jgi:asparagine synthase (glutamine-hydrolysing)
VCGIAGVLAPHGERVDRAVLERMIGTLRHRGPDALGYHVDGRIGLAVARLRVIDLETGDQPIANEDGSARVVLNGEIYNFATLRADLVARGHAFTTRSDTEVIVHAWDDYGEHCVDHLNGMFALALWDARRGALFLARDRMGEKPLFYARPAGWLVFASELQAVLAHPLVSRELDPESVSRYLAYDFVPDPRSLVRGVAKLPPGHSLVAGDGKVTTARYWEIPFAPDERLDASACIDEIRRRFDDAVRIRLASDVPLGAFLSGGIDSTAVVATAVRCRAGIQTFSVGYAEPAYDERDFARRVAGRLGTRHEELLVTAADAGALVPRLGALMDEPLADMSFVPLHLLSRAARRSVTVALTGDGGDEIFAGYPTMAADWWHRAFARLPAAMRRALGAAAERCPAPEALREFVRALDYAPAARNQALLGGLAAARHRPLLARDVRALLDAFDPYDEIDAALAGCDTNDPTARLIHRYCKLYLAGQNLMNTDRASMAVGLELRAPFLDHTFVEFMGRVPSRLKLRGVSRVKWLLKRALADRLPPETLARGKQGFGVPFGLWFRGPLAGLLRDTLDPARIARGGVLDAAAVARLVDEHIGGVRDHRKILWALVVLELWHAHHIHRA